jgi:hypothetical protein
MSVWSKYSWIWYRLATAASHPIPSAFESLFVRWKYNISADKPSKSCQRMTLFEICDIWFFDLTCQSNLNCDIPLPFHRSLNFHVKVRLCVIPRLRYAPPNMPPQTKVKTRNQTLTHRPPNLLRHLSIKISKSH